MSTQNAVQGLFESFEIQRAIQRHAEWQVVERTLWLELIQEPDPFLCERQGGGIPASSSNLLLNGKVGSPLPLELPFEKSPLFRWELGYAIRKRFHLGTAINLFLFIR